MEQEGETVDVRFKNFFTCMLAGSSGSGKTTWVFNFLKNINNLYTIPPTDVYFFYKEWQPMYAENSHLVTEFIQDSASLAFLREKAKTTSNITCIIDDQFLEANVETSDLFTKGSHHLKLNVFFIVQNLFWKSPFSRTISLNATYIVIFRNPRDKSSITHFAKQFDPNNVRTIRKIYEEATSKPYGYLIFDLHQGTDDRHRMLSNIFREDNSPPKIYIRK